jgi:hypothetical protein
MPDTWNAQTYWARAQRTQAESLPPGQDRDACIELAKGYEHLAALIEKENEGRIGC